MLSISPCIRFIFYGLVPCASLHSSNTYAVYSILFWHLLVCTFFLSFLLPFLPSFFFMLSLELCLCSSDFSLSRRPRTGLATPYSILLGMVEARSVNAKNTHTYTHTSNNRAIRESVSPLSRLIRGFRNKYH